MGLLEAYNYVIQACNDPNIGYSQDKRYSIQLGSSEKTYCDCSSLLSKAMTVGGYFSKNPWFFTAVQDAYMSQAGWAKMSPDTTWQAGDILWRSGHTEMVYDGPNRITMGAHTDKYPFSRQVSINTSSSKPSSWTTLYRDTGGIVPTPHTWISGNRYLKQSEMENNAVCAWIWFGSHGYTRECVAGMLGNMQRESVINPGMWQDLTVGSGGFGLTQETPPTNMRAWLIRNGYQVDDGDGQCEYIDKEHNNDIWYTTTRTPETFAQFKVSTKTPEYLAMVFMLNWERPKNQSQSAIDERGRMARYWYNFLDGINPGDPGGGGWIIPGWNKKAAIQIGAIMKATKRPTTNLLKRR